MALEWFSREPADSQRLTFMGDADDTIQFEVVNSTELRAIALKMTAVRRLFGDREHRLARQQCPSGTPWMRGDGRGVTGACW